METFQNRNLTSTTGAFCVMNMMARPAEIRININLRFIFFIFAWALGNCRESAFLFGLRAHLFLSECHPKQFSRKLSFFEFVYTHYLKAFCEVFYH